MTLSRKLRETVRKKLKVGPRQLLNCINAKAIEAGIADRDVALLLLAHENEMDVSKPRFAVPKNKIDELNEHLRVQKAQAPIMAAPPSTKKGAKAEQVQVSRLLKFKGKYPEVFYDSLEDEINTAYGNPKLPNAVLMLSRKLIENLAYNLLEYRFGGKQIGLYYDTKNRRAHDFSVLLDNLNHQKSDFDIDLHEKIDKFLGMAHNFRLDANSKVHKVMEYLDSRGQLKKLKIPDMTQILLNLIERVKSRK